MYAWGAIASAFGVIALLALIPLLSSGRKRRILSRAVEQRAAKAEAERNRNPEWWQDPAILLTGLQVVRTIGFRRLLPILAVGAVVAGVAISRLPGEDAESGVQPAE